MRCPFCHDVLGIDEPWLACARCLARHHEECWDDHRACTSCRCATHLAPTTAFVTCRSSPRRVAARRRRRLVGALAVGSLAANFLGLGVLLLREGHALAPFIFTLF